MSDAPDEERLEELREERLQELQEQKQGESQEQAQEQARQQAEAQKQAMLRQALTDGARQRLNSVRMSKPDFAEKVEQQVVALARSGRLGDEKIDDEQMKELLSELKPDSKSFNIRRR
ncbi:MAG: DNA-binding protein [Halobacteriales archaeon]|nr:DNA-binding protein [Halobacteriales archaeon]